MGEDIHTADLNEEHLIHMRDFLTIEIVRKLLEKFQ